jgi:GTP-binding protein
VVDGKGGLSPVDEELAQMLRKSQKPVVLVINKIDIEKHDPLAVDFDSLGFEKVISVSAEHDRGVSELLDEIELLLPSPENIVDPTLARESVGNNASDVEDPIALAIVGRPNVGKSSLINSIVGGERAIVSELPGTTRDAVDIVYGRDGWQFVFIDTAGIRRRGKVSSSAEVFSVMRAERSIRRADVCILVVDLTTGVTAQDKRIGGLIQKAQKPAIIVLNKWDLIKPRRRAKQSGKELIEETRTRIFFLNYAPELVTSASTGENVDRLFALIEKIQRTARKRIGTGVLNRLLRQAFESNPPPLVKGRRLKLLYAAQTTGDTELSAKARGVPVTSELVHARHIRHEVRRTPPLHPPEFVLFVNDPRSMTESYRRYLEARIRETEPYAGLPIILTLRARAREVGRR